MELPVGYEVQKDNNQYLANIHAVIGSNGSQIHVSIQKGFPYSICEIVQHEFEISEKELAIIIGISQRTVTRRKESGRLTFIESDRLYRSIRVLLFAGQVFGDNKKVSAWLKSPNKGLGGLIPLNLLETDAGTREVHNVLHRITDGIFG